MIQIKATPSNKRDFVWQRLRSSTNIEDNEENNKHPNTY